VTELILPYQYTRELQLHEEYMAVKTNF